jgi:hypothetical protein
MHVLLVAPYFLDNTLRYARALGQPSPACAWGC